MENSETTPDQDRLSTQETEHPCGQQARRREHAGAPSAGIDYGFEFSETGGTDAQGYVEVSVSIIPIAAFDYEAVYRDLDGANREEAKNAIIGLAADALGEMLEWVQEEFVTPGSGVRWNPETSLRCKLALIRLYRAPASLGNPTLTRLAGELDISPQKLSVLWAEFKNRFPGVRAAWEKSERARQAYRLVHRRAA